MAVNSSVLEGEKDNAKLAPEKPAGPKVPEKPVDLEGSARAAYEALAGQDQTERLEINSLSQEVKRGIDDPAALLAADKANETLEQEAGAAKGEVKARIEAVLASAHDLPERLALTDKRALHTKYQKINPAAAEAGLKKIPPDMQTALQVCGRVFKNCEYPWTVAGSNALVLEADTAKIGDDLDIMFAIQDFPQVYKDFASLEQTGAVSGLHVQEMKDFSDRENGCFKISGRIKTGAREIEFEAFGQNIDPDKPANGLVNIGLDEHQVNVYQIPGAKGEATAVNMIDKAGVEKLYFQNLLNEFKLYELSGWENRRFLNSKAIQRIANLQNLGNSVEGIIGALPETGVKTPAAEDAKMVIKNLWSDLQADKFKGPGLTKSLGEKLNLPDNNQRREKVVDFITKETGQQMEAVATASQSVRAMSQAAERTPDPKVWEDLSEIIKEKINQVAAIRDQYQTYLNLVSGQAAEEDFAPYAALSRLKDYFAQPVLTDLIVRQTAVEEKLLALKN